jgi:tRNA-specific 2-thiouridylase
MAQALEKKTRIGVAVSGGADSLQSLILLRDQGCAPTAVHALLTPERRSGDALCTAIQEQCRILGLECLFLDLRQQFKTRVMDPFVRGYLAGLTPNPCALCNREIKFNLMIQKVREKGLDILATGHYARLEKGGLRRGRDRTKDQSYFLALVNKSRLKQVLFPLGREKKTTVLADLAAMGLTPCAGRESLEVCFVPGDYKDFLQSQHPELPGPGPIVDSSGQKLGEHGGLWRHTLGQRRGLGIAHAHPLYVLDKDLRSNALVVGPWEELRAHGLQVRDLNLLVPLADWPDRVLVQTRYRQGPTSGQVRLLEPGTLDVRLDEPQHRPTPGQVAAFYDQDRLLGGGIIRRPATNRS